MYVDIQINEAVTKLTDFANRLQPRAEAIARAVTEKGKEVATDKFSKAEYDGINDVVVKAKLDKADGQVIAEGTAVLFIEYGTGTLAMNDHPNNPYERGTYGKGRGANPPWTYLGDKSDPHPNGEVIHKIEDGKYAGQYVIQTLGNKSNNCMYEADKEMRKQIGRTVKGVFKGK